MSCGSKIGSSARSAASPRSKTNIQFSNSLSRRKLAIKTRCGSAWSCSRRNNIGENLMKKRPDLHSLLLAAILLLMAPGASSAQTLLEKKFSATAESEALLDLTASAPGTSWRERGAEAAVATIYVDGQYHQDVILFAGARDFTYQLTLGRVGTGEHSLRVEFNRKQSAE